MLTLSKYNIEIKGKSVGRYIVYNTLYDSLIQLESPLKTFLLSAKPTDIKQLISMGFIYEEYVNEIEKVNETRTMINQKEIPSELHITIAPTLYCNARCSYCYENNHKSTISDNTIENLLKFIDESYSQFKKIHITWFGGEPLLELSKIVRISSIIRKKYELRSSMITNGSLLTSENLAQLSQFNFCNFQISLDGYGETYRQRKNYIKEIPFETIISNIENCLNNHFNVSLRLNIDKDNFENIIQLIDIFDNMGNKEYLSLYPAFLYGKNVKNPYLSEKEKEAVFYRLLSLIDKKGLFSRKNMIRRNMASYPCMAHANNSFVIDYDGNLFHCEHDVGVAALSYYNINTKYLNKSSKNIIPLNSDPKCLNCCFYPKCLGGCDACRREKESPCSDVKYSIMYFLKCIANGKKDTINFI